MTTTARVLLAFFVCLGTAFLAGQAPPDFKTLTQDELFHRTRIWNAHLTFTADQWSAIAPMQIPRSPHPQGSGGEWLQGREGRRNGWRTAQFGIEFNYVHGNLELDGMSFKDVAVRFKGSATYSPQSMNAVKNSFKIDLNKYVKGQKLADASTLNFHNVIADPSWLNEVLSYWLYRDAGVPASRTAYVKVSLTVPGMFDNRYLGLYVLVENVDSNFVGARFKSDEGAILKPVSVKLFNDLGTDWANYNQTYDPKTDLTAAEQQRIMQFCRFVTSASDATFAEGIGNFVDLDQFARYFAVLVWMNNWDSLLERGQNFYMHLNPVTKKFVFIPWDQDASFGTFPPQDRLAPGTHATWSIYGPWPAKVRLVERLMALPAFRTAYLTRMREFSGTIFQPERFRRQLAELGPILRPVVMMEPMKIQMARIRPGETTVQAFDRIASGESDLLPFTIARHQNVTAQLAKPSGIPGQ